VKADETGWGKLLPKTGSNGFFDIHHPKSSNVVLVSSPKKLF